MLWADFCFMEPLGAYCVSSAWFSPCQFETSASMSLSWWGGSGSEPQWSSAESDGGRMNVVWMCWSAFHTPHTRTWNQSSCFHLKAVYGKRSDGRCKISMLPGCSLARCQGQTLPPYTDSQYICRTSRSVIMFFMYSQQMFSYRNATRNETKPESSFHHTSSV